MKFKYCIFIAFLLVISGCKSSNSPNKDAPTTLRTCLATDILSLDPRKGVSMGTQGVLRMLFAGLVRLDKTLNPQLELAESYRVSADNTTYTFILKHAHWSDGSPITAYDFEETWKAALTPAYSSTCTNLFYGIKNARNAFLGQVSLEEVGVKALGDKILQVELEIPNPHFLNVLVNSVFSPVHPSIRRSPPDPANLICSGPFCLKKYAFQDKIILVKNPHYWNCKGVRIDELHYYIIKDAATCLLMFEKKEVDWIGDPLCRIQPDSVPRLRSQGLLHTNSAAGLHWLFVNTAKYPLNNAHIRKALAYAIDRQMIMSNLLYISDPNPTLGLIPQILKKERWHPWFKDHDVHQAKVSFQKGLQEMGISSEQFPKLTLCCSSASNTKVIEAIQQMWKENLGVEISIKQVDGSVLFSRWYDHNYELTYLGWVLQYNDPVNMLEIFKYKDRQPNYSGWENRDFIQHATASLTAITEEGRWSHVEAAEKVFSDEMPSIPLMDYIGFYLVQPYVKNVFVNPLLQVDFDRAFIEH